MCLEFGELNFYLTINKKDKKEELELVLFFVENNWKIVYNKKAKKRGKGE